MTNILDHGYINIITSWGSDENIVASARMSTSGTFNNWEKDAKLLQYLYSHKHLTPFEMCGAQFEIQCPIFVAREWMRHRTQCLAGSTRIPYFSPNGTSACRTIKQLVELKCGVEDTAPTKTKNGYSKAGTPVMCESKRKNRWRTRILPNCQTRILRTIDENTGEISFGQTADMYESGIKEIYRLRLNNGITLDASALHPVLTTEGWIDLANLRPNMLVATAALTALKPNAMPPQLRSGIGVWTSMMRKRLIKPVDVCYICNKEFFFSELVLDHIVPVRENLELALIKSNLAPACVMCHREKTNKEQYGRKGQMGIGRRWEAISAIPIRIGEDQTYDISMSGPNANFVANGIFVHNSFNEMSGRYTKLPNLCYVPSLERLKVGGQSKDNKQSSGKQLNESTALCAQREIQLHYGVSYKTYEELLHLGISREIARSVLPVNQYTKFRAQANLRNWLQFLELRLPDNAQWEIRQYAQEIQTELTKLFPRTMELFNAQIE